MGNGALVFNADAVSVLKDEKNSGDGLYNDVSILNASELHT